MIKIAVLSTDILAKKTFCNQLVKEFDGRGQGAIILTETSGESPFKGDIECYIEDTLWTWSKAVLKELEATLQYDAAIVKCSALEPFLFAEAHGFCYPKLELYRLAANEWMESYDTIVWLKNLKLEKEYTWEACYESTMEHMYASWTTERLGKLPISVIDSANVFKDREGWLI